MLWSVGINLNTTTVTPVLCRIRCAPYAYMGKVHAGNSVPSFPRERCRSYYYKWMCSRVYLVENCRVGPAGITLGTPSSCFPTHRWGRNTPKTGASGQENEELRYSSDYPHYLHCFRYDPNECFEATKGPRFLFSPWTGGLPGATCHRSPTGENLSAIKAKFDENFSAFFEKERPCVLLFYYEAFGGQIYYRKEGDGCPARTKTWDKTTTPAGRDYWLTVFAV